MCHFITAVLPNDIDIAACNEIAKKYHRVFEPLKDQFVLNQLDHKKKYYALSQGSCDCGTVWSKGNRFSKSGKENEREVRKLRNQGWSEAKIKRWKENRQQSRQNQLIHLRSLKKDCNALAQIWIQFISEIINTGLSNNLGILLHWYSGTLETEKINIQNIVKIGLSEMNSSVILNAEEDVLYTFVKEYR